jgi:serum/glucocorticoid-regulated kinase 2
MLNKI